MRLAAAAALALGMASCYGHDRPVGDAPTPLAVKSSGSQQSQAMRDREQMNVQGPHGDGPDAAELAKNGATCSADSDCAGRLRCVAYSASGRDVRKCLFPCGDGCPAGWNCQIVSDGPTNTCARAR
jgi:hypothetical protein